MKVFEFTGIQILEKYHFTKEDAEAFIEIIKEAKSDDLSTKGDILRLEAGTTDEINQVRMDIAKLEASTRDNIAKLEASTRDNIARLEASTRDNIAKLEASTKDNIAKIEKEIVEIKKDTRALEVKIESVKNQLVIWIITVMFAMTTLFTLVVKYL